jgi:hypothetical protein
MELEKRFRPDVGLDETLKNFAKDDLGIILSVSRPLPLVYP